MTKQETIKNHYITEFINSGMSQQEAEQKWEHSEEFINPDDGYFQNREEYYRPTSLRGIETNNSWIRIESEKDLPSEDCDVFLYFKDGEIMCDRFLLNYKNFATINYIHVSHYQPITKPLQPLH